MKRYLPPDKYADAPTSRCESLATEAAQAEAPGSDIQKNATVDIPMARAAFHDATRRATPSEAGVPTRRTNDIQELWASFSLRCLMRLESSSDSASMEESRR